MKMLVFIDELYFTNDKQNYRTKFVSANFWIKFAKFYPEIKLSFSFPVKNGYIENAGNVLSIKDYNLFPINNGWHNIISFCKNYFRYKKQLFALKEIIEKQDIVFIRIPSPAGLILGKLANSLGKRVIYNIVGDIKKACNSYKFPFKIPAYFLSQYLYKKELFQNGIFLTVGSELTNRFKEKKSIFFIDSLIEKEDLSSVKTQMSAPIQLLYVGRLLESKGIFLLIDVIKELNNNIVLNIVGFGKDEKKIKQLSQEYEFINFYGKISNRNKLNIIYRNSDIFVLPTINYPEGFPRVILEAWENGLYVVSSKVGGIEGLAKDKENILFFKPGDKKEFLEKLNMLIDNKNIQKNLKTGIKNIQKQITFEYYADVLYKVIKG